MFQLKAPDAKLMPIREDVEELFGIEELRVNINVFIVDNRYVFCCNQLVVKTVKVVANYSSYCYYVCISLSFFILIFFFTLILTVLITIQPSLLRAVLWNDAVHLSHCVWAQSRTEALELAV